MSHIQSVSDEIYPVISEAGGVYSRKERYDTKRLFGAESAEKVSHIETDTLEKVSIDERDLRKKQDLRGWTVVWLAYQYVGVIYGDIGTSPLYVYSSTFSAPTNYDDLLGALSPIIYALTITVTTKYVIIVLNADDEGEGGTFALYSLISRYARLVNRHPREEAMTRIERHRTGDMPTLNSRVRSVIENSLVTTYLFKVVGVLGVALLLADEVLTPVQSILAAIQGLTVVQGNISSSLIVGVSCAVLY